MLKSPIEPGDLCLLLKGYEKRLLDDSLRGVVGVRHLSLGLLVGLALAFADAVGLM